MQMSMIVCHGPMDVARRGKGLWHTLLSLKASALISINCVAIAAAGPQGNTTEKKHTQAKFSNTTAYSLNAVKLKSDDWPTID